MHCHEFVDNVTEYLEGALPAPARSSWQSHLAACPHCAEYFAQFRTSLRLLRALGERKNQAMVSRSRNP